MTTELLKRPKPPPGYIPFKWKHRPYERDKSVSVQVCPLCGNFGSVWSGGGFTDPEAQKLFGKLLRADNGYCSYDLLCHKYEGVMIKEHWSRYGEGYCSKCKVKYWHDFVGYPWQYYYNPDTAEEFHEHQMFLPIEEGVDGD